MREPLSDDDVRALLRGATGERLLAGWYSYQFGGRRWVVAPSDADPKTFTTVGIVRYCRGLQDAGVRPLYT
jgi:hypothetical protein